MAVLQANGSAATIVHRHVLRAAPALAALAVILASGPSLAAFEPLFSGTDALDLELSETGSVTGRATHDYSSSDWIRAYTLDVEWTRVGVYTVGRMEGFPAFAGQGEEYREATGTLEVELDDQGYTSRLVCTLNLSETRQANALLFQVDGTLVGGVGRGFLDADAWECDDSEVISTTHGGVGDVVLAGYALAGVEGLEANAFPAEVAFALGLADSEEEWDAEDRQDEHVNDLLRLGYIEGEPKLGEQRIAFARSAPADEGLSWLVCPDMGVDETPATSSECAVESETKLTLSRVGSAPSRPTTSSSTETAPSATLPPANGDGGAASTGAGAEATDGNATPGPGALVLAACVACAALGLRRRSR